MPDLTLVLDVTPGGRAGAAGGGGQGARPDGTRERASFTPASPAAYLAAAGPGVQHLNAELPADRLAEAAWAALEQQVEADMKQRWSITALIAVLSFLSGGWLLQRGTGGDGGVYEQARLFDDVLSHVRNFYVDSIAEADLYTKATNGMLDELKDPYSVLLTGDDYKALTEKTSGNYAGLGIQIDVRDGWITVVAPLPDTPAERAGIQTGDQIIEVDGKSTEGWNSDQAVKSLRGEPGSQRGDPDPSRPASTRPIPYKLNRATIHIRSVPAGTEFDGGVGYISLNPVPGNLRAGTARRDRGDARQGDEGAGPRPAQQPGRPARPGHQGVRPLPRSRPGGRVHPRPRAGQHPAVLRRGEAARPGTADRGAGRARAPPAPPRSSPARCRITTVP